ncbi:MAG: putative Ig domain-containing protein [Terriglobales bacterium]
MPRGKLCVSWALLLLFAAALAAQQPVPFQILTTHLPPPQAGQRYEVQLEATGGQPPYAWKILRGALPEGLHFDPDGRITGQPATDEPFSLLVEVRDAAHPPLTVTRLLPTATQPPIALRWTAPPAAGASGENSGGQITGAFQADYHGDEPATLTLFAVAVNETGKAFSLRYDHRQLPPGATTGPLTFDVFLPPGLYRVQVDAIAEIRPGVIYRARLTRPPLDMH